MEALPLSTTQWFTDFAPLGRLSRLFGSGLGLCSHALTLARSTDRRPQNAVGQTVATAS
jgi:hypothetical protein